MSTDINLFIKESDGVKLTVKRQDSGTVYLSIQTGSTEVTFFDYSEGFNLLKIADAIMTWNADEELAEARKQAEREHFALLCDDCLTPLAECVHATEYAGA